MYVNKGDLPCLPATLVTVHPKIETTHLLEALVILNHLIIPVSISFSVFFSICVSVVGVKIPKP